jgi:hypothetical protein
VDCHAFDGQVVRLERLKDLADRFVRVRLTRIDEVDLNLFDFDYDLTFMVFFLSPEGKVYARYGGRDGESPDRRQSLDGLRYTMQSVLRMHERQEPAFAPQARQAPRFLREVSGARRPGQCLHCHQVKEVLDAAMQRAGQWSRDQVWRYPLPENLGLELEVDRGNVVKAVTGGSPAAAAGLRSGDVVHRLGGVPIHSFADAQFALDRAPKGGAIELAWQRGDRAMRDKLSLPEGWRKTDVSWRASVRRLVAAARLSGKDLTPQEKQALGLSANQLAFRHWEVVHSQAKAAGVRGGDVILGVDDKQLDTDVSGFQRYIERNYLVGDQVTVNLLRDGKRLNLPMTFLR